MRITGMMIYLAATAALSGTAVAQDAPTVQSLLKQDFAVVGAMTSAAGGAGLFLHKKDQLLFCFVAETPESPTVKTRYCKPVE